MKMLVALAARFRAPGAVAVPDRELYRSFITLRLTSPRNIDRLSLCCNIEAVDQCWPLSLLAMWPITTRQYG